MTSFQIGPLGVDAQVLDVPGRSLAAIADEFEARVDDDGPSLGTRDGWRVLRSSPGGEVILGAEEADDPGAWRLARIAPVSEGSPTVFVTPDAERIRPGRAERRAGLALRWPSFTAEDHAAGRWAIDIVNAGPARWTPDGDGFHVVGVLVEPGVSDATFGYAQLGRPTAVPLDPGEYARVPVLVDSAVWSKREPGEYELRALLTDLSMPSLPLPVTVTADTIRRHRVPVREMYVDPDVRRRRIEFDIGRLSAQIVAGRDLESLVVALGESRSHTDALTTIAETIGCDARSAETVLHSALRELLPMNHPELERQLSEAQRSLDDD